MPAIALGSVPVGASGGVVTLMANVAVNAVAPSVSVPRIDRFACEQVAVGLPEMTPFAVLNESPGQSEGSVATVPDWVTA